MGITHQKLKTTSKNPVTRRRINRTQMHQIKDSFRTGDTHTEKDTKRKKKEERENRGRGARSILVTKKKNKLYSQ